MKYTEKEIDALREIVKGRLSEKRFNHTLGVEAMAVKIAKKCLPEKINELRAAALLHDISKEYSEAEHFEIAKRYNVSFSKADMMTPALWHSITAPLVVMEEFVQFATNEIKGAIYNHTAGAPDMSVFDEIIFLADYIEEGRTFLMCTNVREEYFNEIMAAKNREECIFVLHRAMVLSLDNTIKWFVSRGKTYHERTALTRDAILKKLERQNNGNN